MKHYKPETLAIRTQVETTSHKEHSAPLFLTSSFIFDDAEAMRAIFADETAGNIYSRFSNPNSQEFIDKLCVLEQTEDGIATATGMAAIFATFMGLLQSGDHILSSASVFGSTHTLFTKLFPKWGITHTYFTSDSIEKLEQIVQPNTKVLYCETPSNPGLQILDLELLSKFCHQHSILLIVDNCFATPYLQNPTKFGADIIIHSATKYIDGQGRVLGGAILGSKEIIEKIRFFARHSGPSMSPFNAWLLSKSLETLAIRMEKHSSNAEKIVEYLENNTYIEKVMYPFSLSHPQYHLAKKQMKLGGGIVTCIIKGGIDNGKRFIDELQMCSLSANLGDTRTIVTHPASTTHSKLTEEERQYVGILPGLIRISVGLEHHTDIINDIQQALEKCQ
ncbi:MAG: aminotransferase class I/II-fold pyridoxal phosphate-dependent enzyme [Candidatus Kapabacteria bacterium]|nr:aminotransferase class I/II-fold pyridoxal phosphate-dependent enzyme [Candidatus Kapabacteria bacterium]